MQRFKIGQKVRCRDEGGSRQFPVKYGEIYTVSGYEKKRSHCSIELVHVKEHPQEVGYFEHRFESCTLTNEERIERRRACLNLK